MCSTFVVVDAPVGRHATETSRISKSRPIWAFSIRQKESAANETHNPQRAYA